MNTIDSMVSKCGFPFRVFGANWSVSPVFLINCDSFRRASWWSPPYDLMQ
jgi:hypothetical protein